MPRARKSFRKRISEYSAKRQKSKRIQRLRANIERYEGDIASYRKTLEIDETNWNLKVGKKIEDLVSQHALTRASLPNLPQAKALAVEMLEALGKPGPKKITPEFIYLYLSHAEGLISARHQLKQNLKRKADLETQLKGLL